jgi:hypothetical protein
MFLLSRRGFGNVLSRRNKSSPHPRSGEKLSKDSLRSVGHFIDALSSSKELPTQELNSLVRASMFHANNLTPENTTKLLRFLASNSKLINIRMNNLSLEIVDTRLLERYSEKIIDSNLERYTATDLAVVLNSFCRLGFIRQDLFRSIADFLKSRPDTFTIPERSLGMIYNAFARANIYNSDLFEKLSIFLNKSLTSVSTHTAGNICHALGKLRIANPSAVLDVSKIASHVITNHASRLTPQELSNILYSLGNMGINNPELTEPLIQIAKRKVRKFNPIEVAAICTSLTKLAISDDSLMKQIANLVESQSSRYTPYEFVAVLHAFSQLDTIVPQKLFTDIFPTVITADIDPKTACIAFNAFARIGIQPPAPITDTLKTAILQTSDSQYLINVLFSAGQLFSGNLSEDDSFFINTLCESIKASPVMNPINCTQLIFALNKLKKTDNPLYFEIVSGAILLIPEFEVNQISNILYGLSLNGSPLTDNELELATGLIASRRIVADGTPQLVSSITESVAALGIGDSGVWETLTRAVIAKCPEHPKIDLRTLSAILRQDKVMTKESVDVITKRMNVAKLGTDDLTKCLQLIVDYGINVPNLISGIYTAVIERIETMSNLNGVLGLMSVLNSPKRFPSDLYTAEDQTRDGGNFADLCCRLDERFASFVSDDEKIEYSVSALNHLRNVKNDALRRAVTDQLISVVKGGTVGLETLARVTKFLSPQYDKSLSRIVKQALVREGDTLAITKHTLRIASALLRIDSPELAHLMMDFYIPKWLKAMVEEYPELVREWVATCPVAICDEAVAIAIKAYDEGEKVDLRTYCMLTGSHNLVADIDRSYSLDEVADVAIIANRDRKQRLVAEHIVRIRPQMGKDVRRESFTKYIGEVGVLARHVDICKYDCSGTQSVVDELLTRPRLSIGDQISILELCMVVEYPKPISQILKSVMTAHHIVPDDQAKQLQACLVILKSENPAWVGDEYSESLRLDSPLI